MFENKLLYFTISGLISKVNPSLKFPVNYVRRNTTEIVLAGLNHY
jgi:hypothetical protein